jgi:hypothetical protein
VTFLPQAWVTMCGGGGGVSGVPLAMGKTPMVVADSGDLSWVVGSARTTAQWHGDG